MVGRHSLGIGRVVSTGFVLEHNVRLIVLEASIRADSETELRAEMDGRVDGFESAHEEHNAALLKSYIEAEVLRQGGRKVRRWAGLSGPIRVWLVQGRSLEEDDGGRDGVGEETHPRGERLRFVAGGGVGVGFGVGWLAIGQKQAKQVDRFSQMGMESVEGVDVDGDRLREAECLWRNGSKLETESLDVQACVSNSADSSQGEYRNAAITPLTMRVPTRVMVPLTRSLRGVLITSVLPGSTGASRA